MYSLETKLDNLEIKLDNLEINLDKIVDILDQLIQQNIDFMDSFGKLIRVRRYHLTI